MKISFVVLCCLVLTLKYTSVTGGLVKNLFEKVHNTAHHVREDIENALHLHVNDSKSNETVKEKDQVPTKTDTEPVDKNKESTTLPSNDSKVTTTTTAPKEEITPPTTQSVSVSTTVPTVTTTAVTDTKANATEGEGKENFKANCQTGYQRTADGRCKPTF